MSIQATALKASAMAPVLFINQDGANTFAGKAELLAKALGSLSRLEPGKNLAIPGYGPSQIHRYPWLAM